MTEILTLRKGTVANDYSYETFWRDDFKGDLSKWISDDLSDSLHRVGNNWLCDDGSISEHKWQSPTGARWAGLYNGHKDKVEYISADGLVQGIHAVNEPNPYRESYSVVEYRDPQTGKTVRKAIPDGEELPKQMDEYEFLARYPYGEWKLYQSWLSTGGTRIYNKDIEGEKQTDFSKPHSFHGRGSYINMKVNYEGMCVRNARHSLWSMPNHEDKYENTPENPAPLAQSDSYDEITENGVEIDVIEYVYSRRRNYELLSMKNVCGPVAGDTPDGSVNFTEAWKEFGIDMRHGWHDIGCAWYPDGHHDWFVDGHQTNHDPRIVKTMNYLALTEEINSGVKHAKEGKQVNIPSGGPKRPRDPGLSGSSAILDVDLMPEHKAVIRDISLHKMTLRKAQVNGFTPKPEALPKKDPIPRVTTIEKAVELTHDDAQVIRADDVPHTCSQCGHVDGTEPLFTKSPSDPMPTAERFMAPELSVNGTTLTWTNYFEEGVHGVNIKHNGGYLTTVTGENRFDVGPLKGEFSVKVINKDATKTSKNSNAVVI